MKKISAYLSVLVAVCTLLGFGINYTSTLAKAEEVKKLESFTKKSFGEIYLDQTEQKINEIEYKQQMAPQPPSEVEIQYLNSLKSRKSRLLRELEATEFEENSKLQ